MPTPRFRYINPISKDKRGLGDIECAGKMKILIFKLFQLKSVIQWEQQNKKPPEGGFSQNSKTEIRTCSQRQLKHWLR
jgi:hypothetical protein